MLIGSALGVACARKRAPRYQGWLLVASGAQRAISVSSLAQFAPATTIPVQHTPDQLLLAGDRIYASSREGAELMEIDPAGFRVTGRIALPGRPVAVQILPGASLALVLTDSPAAILSVDLPQRRVAARLNLPATPFAMSLPEAGGGAGIAALTLPARSSLLRVFTSDLKIAGETPAGGATGAVRFRKDGKTILAGVAASREIVTFDAVSGRVLTRLPLPIAPRRFCFNQDGGQMFVTGSGEDALVIVDPYQNEVDQTILAGRTPGPMAVSAKGNLLFVANPGSGDLTILDIESRHLAATVHVGGNPGQILLTPDNEYALIVDPEPGTVSVVRLTTVLDRGQVAMIARAPKPLFTVFQTAADARSAIIVPFGARTS